MINEDNVRDREIGRRTDRRTDERLIVKTLR